MTATRHLHALGQRLWLDNITRRLLDGGGLQHYIETAFVTGLTSNPSIFDAAIGGGDAYDTQIRSLDTPEASDEAIFNELALTDLRRAADLFAPMFEASDGLDGWVSMEVSPVLAGDTEATVAAGRVIHQQADRANLLVKIPGTPQGVDAIEETIFSGVPVNVTLLFSREQYLAAANAYLRGLERRRAAGLDLQVASVASVFVSRWDQAVAKVAAEQPDNEQLSALRNQLGIAVAQRTYRAHCELLDSSRWRELAALGARPQRLLWASTGSKDPAAPESLYAQALAAPGSINTLPEKTLQALLSQAEIGDAVMARDGGECEATLARFSQAGVDVDHMAESLQAQGVTAFVASWWHLLQVIADKRAARGG